jgi:hypothetical protein
MAACALRQMMAFSNRKNHSRLREFVAGRVMAQSEYGLVLAISYKNILSWLMMAHLSPRC